MTTTSSFWSIAASCLSEGEHVRLDTRRVEDDLEGAVDDRPLRAHELVEPWLDHRPVTVLVGILAAVGGRGLAVDEHAERHRPVARAQHEVHVARVEAVGD